MDVLLIAVALLFIAVGVVGAVGLLLLELLAKLEQMVQPWLLDERRPRARFTWSSQRGQQSRHGVR